MPPFRSGSVQELAIALEGPGRRAQLQDHLRSLIQDGALPAGTRLPSSRTLADDLGVSRRLVVEAYAQLVAEGYLTSRQGAGTFVAATLAAAARPGPAQAEPSPPPRIDFFPGSPDLFAFPRMPWLRAMREVLRTAPAKAFAYTDAQGAPALRESLAGYLRRVRGVVTRPESIVICSGATQGLSLLTQALSRRGIDAISVEDPCLPPHRALLAYAGLRVSGTPVDEEGVDVAAIRSSAVLTTPAHQAPTGVVLSPGRRAAMVEWARRGGLVIEDDYDGEFRYDRSAPAALQGLAPDRIAYIGTVSKTLAPGMRLGWLVLPPALLDLVVEAKLRDDLGSSVIDQLVLARLIDTAAYDTHLRKVRQRYRARRATLLAAIAEHLPGAQSEGVSAGLHTLVRLPGAVPERDLVDACMRRDVAVYPLSRYFLQPRATTDAIVLGYANLGENDLRHGVRLIAQALEEVRRERMQRARPEDAPSRSSPPQPIS